MYTGLPLTDVVVVPFDDEKSTAAALLIARSIRRYGISCLVDTRPVKIKSKMKYANSLRPYFALIIGPDDLESNVVQVKDMDEHNQITVEINKAPRYVAVEILSEQIVKNRESWIEADFSNPER